MGSHSTARRVSLYFLVTRDCSRKDASRGFPTFAYNLEPSSCNVRDLVSMRPGEGGGEEPERSQQHKHCRRKGERQDRLQSRE